LVAIEESCTHETDNSATQNRQLCKRKTDNSANAKPTTRQTHETETRQTHETDNSANARNRQLGKRETKARQTQNRQLGRRKTEAQRQQLEKMLPTSALPKIVANPTHKAERTA